MAVADNEKEMWWRGFRAALNLPDNVSREDALKIKNEVIGYRELMKEEARNLAEASIKKAKKGIPK